MQRKVAILCALGVLLSLPLAAQRTERFEGGEGNYSGKFRYSAGSERVTLNFISSIGYKYRYGGSIGYGQVLRHDRSWNLDAKYYHNIVADQEVDEVWNLSFTHYWSLIKLGSGSRVLFGLSPTIGYQYAKSLRISGAERHVFLYGLGARLEYEHIIGSSLGLFFGMAQHLEFLNRIDHFRLRHFIDVGIRVGI
jgi:hypothetical protein